MGQMQEVRDGPIVWRGESLLSGYVRAGGNNRDCSFLRGVRYYPDA